MSDIKPIPVKSAYGRGGGRGGDNGGGRGGRGDRSNRSRSGQIQNQRSRPIAQKFKGNYSDLEGYIFDCSDRRQANKYITAIKRIAEYVGAEFKYGGDIRSFVLSSVGCSFSTTASYLSFLFAATIILPSLVHRIIGSS